MQYIFPGVFAAAGAMVFYYGLNRRRRYKLIEETPRSKIRSIAMGLVEIHGTVQSKSLIKTPFSQKDCIYYRYKIEEYTESVSVDSKGRTKTSREWINVGQGEQRVPFFASDETGQIYVDPKGAEFDVEPKAAFAQRKGVFNDFGSIINTLRNWDNMKQATVDKQRWGLMPIDPKQKLIINPQIGDRRYTEYFIMPGEKIFILGTAANRQSAPNGVLIEKGKNEPIFIIGDKSEKSMLKKLKMIMIICFLAGSAMFSAGIYLLLRLAEIL